MLHGYFALTLREGVEHEAQVNWCAIVNSGFETWRSIKSKRMNLKDRLGGTKWF